MFGKMTTADWIMVPLYVVCFLTYIGFLIVACAVVKFLHQRHDDADAIPDPGFFSATGLCLIMTGLNLILGFVWGSVAAGEAPVHAMQQERSVQAAWMVSSFIFNVLIIRPLIETTMIRSFLIVSIQWLLTLFASALLIWIVDILLQLIGIR